MMAALALGTVQFGLRYGVANQTGQVSQQQVNAILAAAASAGVDTLDTAIAYGESEASLGRAGTERLRVVTKLPALPQVCPSIESWIEEQLDGSLRRLGRTSVEAVLLHRPTDLLGSRGEEYLSALQKAAVGRCRLLGVSIYGPGELDALWPFWQPQIVQAPCNVLDRRLLSSGWLGRLAAQAVEVHTRSTFLQGLLLMSAERRPAAFAPWFPLLDRWLGWCREQSLTPLSAAMGFVLTQPGISRVIVGVDSTDQLQEILAAARPGQKQPPADLFSEDVGLIDPSHWKLP